MITKLTRPLWLAVTLLLTALVVSAAPVARLTVDDSAASKPISPLLYGIFFEEINRAGDGGIYAEMIQNRSFEDADFPIAWRLIKSAVDQGSIALDKSQPLNAKNPTSLRLTITNTGGGRVGVASDGFVGVAQRPRERPAMWLPRFENAPGGIAVEQGKKYDLSFYARADQGFSGPLTVSLERQEGGVLASQKIRGIGPNWKKFTVSLTASATDADARLVLAATKPGVIWLDMVSLFPKETYKGRPNGLRAKAGHPKLFNKAEAVSKQGVRWIFEISDQLHDTQESLSDEPRA